ncbi:MAG: anti-sigma F factor [Clostridium sp.]|nr:anti-sigma F factor [Clostridium sp.]
MGARRGYVNEMSLEFDAVSLNESFARVVVAAFITPLNPTVEELADVKTAVSEAVTNAIIHGYDGRGGKINMHCLVTGNLLSVNIEDHGMGIADIGQAMMPLFTTKPELDRSGMGFSFMEAFMDDLKVESHVGEGTKVCMMKKLGDASLPAPKGK